MKGSSARTTAGEWECRQHDGAPFVAWQTIPILAHPPTPTARSAWTPPVLPRMHIVLACPAGSSERSLRAASLVTSICTSVSRRTLTRSVPTARAYTRPPSARSSHALALAGPTPCSSVSSWAAEIPTDREVHERLTKVQALAELSSDAISSVAYATEASLGVLVAAGLGALQLNPQIAIAIAALMVIVGTSYFQTIHAYPAGGGSYLVARDNFGDLPGLIAAAALLIDYVLTVSVSVSSGIDALTSVVRPSSRTTCRWA